jgi:hypothetical protein
MLDGSILETTNNVYNDCCPRSRILVVVEIAYQSIVSLHTLSDYSNSKLDNTTKKNYQPISPIFEARTLWKRNHKLVLFVVMNLLLSVLMSQSVHGMARLLMLIKNNYYIQNMQPINVLLSCSRIVTLLLPILRPK